MIVTSTWLLVSSIKSVSFKICGRGKGWATEYLFICYKIFLNKFIFILGGMEYCLHVDPLQVFMLLCPSKLKIKICQWARLLKENGIRTGYDLVSPRSKEILVSVPSETANCFHNCHGNSFILCLCRLLWWKIKVKNLPLTANILHIKHLKMFYDCFCFWSEQYCLPFKRHFRYILSEQEITNRSSTCPNSSDLVFRTRAPVSHLPNKGFLLVENLLCVNKATRYKLTSLRRQLDRWVTL